VVQFGDKIRPRGAETICVSAASDRLDPHAVVAALGERGFRRILVEGGGTTIGHFLDAGALDRLHVAVSPLLIGAGPAGLNASPIRQLADAMRPRTTVYGLGTDVVFDCAFERASAAAGTTV
jgi:riboflavin biosynthesis pyrimidine reductase